MPVSPWTRAVAALAGGGLALLALSGCASSTAGGALGIERKQLLIVSAEQISAQAAEGYTKLSSAAAQARKLNTDAVQTARLRAIAGRLIPHVKVYRQDALAWKWEVNVFDSDDINAFCMPGGKIGFFSGILTKLALDDAEVAAVMGHEIAHALREHTREKVSQQGLSNAVVLGVAASGSRSAGAAGGAVAVGAQLFLHLPFSRDMESEADAAGLELMARAGYDPRAAVRVWHKMQKATQGAGPPALLRTHPTNEQRIRSIEALLPRVMPLYDAASRAAG
jgi:Zn-dependent protease with chaperone function